MLTVFLVVGGCGASHQDREPGPNREFQITVTDGDGRQRGSLAVSAQTQQSGAEILPKFVLFNRTGSARADDGRVVNGLGLAATQESAGVTVHLFALVPRADRPNTYDPRMENLIARVVSVYHLKPRDQRVIDEASELGFGRLMLDVGSLPMVEGRQRVR